MGNSIDTWAASPFPPSPPPTAHLMSVLELHIQPLHNQQGPSVETGHTQAPSSTQKLSGKKIQKIHGF